MKLSREEVEKVAQLARLEVSPTETEAFSRQLSDVLEYVQQLSAVDTTGVEPTATVLEQANIFREDTVRPSLTPEEAVLNAPETEGGYFVVPKIIVER